MEAIVTRIKGKGQFEYEWGLIIDNEFILCDRIIEVLRSHGKVLAGDIITINNKTQEEL